MKKIDYLKLAFKEKKFTSQDWIIRCFAVMRQENTDNNWYLKPILQPFGYGFINAENEFEQFEDSPKPGDPIFKFSDRIQADVSWAENLKTPTETSIGNLLINAITVLSSFGPKFPFQTGQLNISKFESIIVTGLKDTPVSETERSNTEFYVDEYVKFTDAMLFVRTLSSIISQSATKKNITQPTGIEKFKKDLVEKYKDKLGDAVELAKFENELKDFDTAYLADDPTSGKFTKGKIKNIARKKLFFTLGQELSFDDNSAQKPIINSLRDGWPTDPEQLTAMVNGSRVGSFYRGVETVKGGVAAKMLLRAANNFSISNTDCGAKLGMRRVYNSRNCKQLIGKTVIINNIGKLIPDKETAGSYVGKYIAVRSPMYCRLKGDTICKICAGDKLAQLPTGLSIPLTEISAIILAASMKRMHGVVLSTAVISLDNHFS
jgi:hypothetical protein